jgi:hypothetical protein
LRERFMLVDLRLIFERSGLTRERSGRELLLRAGAWRATAPRRELALLPRLREEARPVVLERVRLGVLRFELEELFRAREGREDDEPEPDVMLFMFVPRERLTCLTIPFALRAICEVSLLAIFRILLVGAKSKRCAT